MSSNITLEADEFVLTKIARAWIWGTNNSGWLRFYRSVAYCAILRSGLLMMLNGPDRAIESFAGEEGGGCGEGNEIWGGRAAEVGVYVRRLRYEGGILYYV